MLSLMQPVAAEELQQTGFSRTPSGRASSNPFSRPNYLAAELLTPQSPSFSQTPIRAELSPRRYSQTPVGAELLPSFLSSSLNSSKMGTQ